MSGHARLIERIEHRCSVKGWVAERFKAPFPKSGRPQGCGLNPTPTAKMERWQSGLLQRS